VFASRPELAERSSRLTVRQLAERQGLEPGLQLVDVRGAAETVGGTIPGAVEIPLAVLADSLDALDQDLPVVAYLAGGYRSVVAASRLAAADFGDVSDLLGGVRRLGSGPGPRGSGPRPHCGGRNAAGNPDPDGRGPAQDSRSAAMTGSPAPPRVPGPDADHRRTVSAAGPQ
jgi:rhodanese-related sulfurtransferase